jgi:hypothetical protein
MAPKAEAGLHACSVCETVLSIAWCNFQHAWCSTPLVQEFNSWHASAACMVNMKGALAPAGPHRRVRRCHACNWLADHRCYCRCKPSQRSPPRIREDNVACRHSDATRSYRVPSQARLLRCRRKSPQQDSCQPRILTPCKARYRRTPQRRETPRGLWLRSAPAPPNSCRSEVPRRPKTS